MSLDDKDDMAHAVLAIMTSAVGEFEASIVEARRAVALNPNSAFTTSTLGLVLGFGGYPGEAIGWLRQAMRASPNDPLTWIWLNGIGDFQFYSREFEVALETYRQVIHLRPRFYSPHLWYAAALAHLGRLDEAREALEIARAQFGEQIERRRQRPPWEWPQNWEIKLQGLRLLGVELR